MPNTLRTPAAARLLRWGLLLHLGTWLLAHEAVAQAPLLDRRVRLGTPPVAVQVSLSSAGGELVLRAAARGRSAEATLPLPAAQEAGLRSITLAGGAQVAIVEASAGTHRAAALIVARRGRAEILWTGRLDSRGDPGERRADRLELEDRTGDGIPDLIVGITHESHRICGQAQTLLFPRALDPATLQLRSVTLRRLPEHPAEGERSLQASREVPDPIPAQRLRGLVMRRASSSLGSGTDPDLLPPASALTDGDPRTSWQEGAAGDGSWEFASGGFAPAPRPIRMFSLVPIPEAAGQGTTIEGSPPEPPRSASPRWLWLLGDSGPRLRIELPTDLRPGERLWITPPEPLRWRCVSIVLGPPTYEAPSGLAELAALTDIDLGAGLAPLLAELAGADRQAAEAARLLSELGEPALAAIEAGWAEMPEQERRLALRILSGQAERPSARRLLAEAAADEELPGLAASALERLDAIDAIEELATVSARLGPLGDEAARRLASRGRAAIPGLLAALRARGGSERAALRSALLRAFDRDPEASAGALREAIGAETPASIRASLSLALSPGGASAQALALELAEGALNAPAFPERYRLGLALERLMPRLPSAPSDRLIAFLLELGGAEEWMLRAQASRILGALDTPEARAALRRGSEDPSPRVRLAAGRALLAQGIEWRRIAALALRDRWPFVRIALLEAIGERSAELEARAIARAALGDRFHPVRAAAVRALTAMGDRESLEPIRSRLASEQEWPDVLSAAIGFART
ncbi:MAG: HEAT repeat domain-containing protein, partial [Myxococcales bacterium]|nr:HEAT repeat domain-containing protein [Myxococcales bacterium]